MAVETKVSTATVQQNPAVHTQNSWQKYAKPAAIVIGIAVLALVGWLLYNSQVAEPKEESAQKAIYKAEEYFRQDSSAKVLNGDGINKGVLYVINNYGGTKTANLARFYAGVSYLKTGKFNEAIKYLADFTTDSKPLQLKAYGCLGDAYAELNKKTEAIDAYKKAAAAFEADETNSAEYLFRAALLSEVNGKNKEALDLYKQLKDKFPGTPRGSQADKYIYRLNVEPNEFSTN